MLLLRTGHQIISSIADDNIKALSWSDEWGNDMLTEEIIWLQIYIYT